LAETAGALSRSAGLGLSQAQNACFSASPRRLFAVFWCASASGGALDLSIFCGSLLLMKEKFALLLFLLYNDIGD